MGFLRRALFAFFVVSAAPSYAQLSPGKLAEPHAFLEGMRNCLKCHELGAGPSVEKCLDCHEEIAVRLDREEGYHHLVVNKQHKPCFECHGDHAGRSFHLVYWPGGVDNFKHDDTGFKLEGKHGELKCRKCHRPDFITEDFTAFGDQVNAKRTFLGLGQACLSCHRDEHHEQLGNDCLRCHTNDAWKPARGFDHQKTPYPLTGRHRDLACAKCHPSVTVAKERFVKYTGIPHDECTTCHKDVHKGTLGNKCSSCHRTSGWHDISVANFDHSRTRFPLVGRHSGLACEKCHAPGKKKGNLAHDQCTDCHRDEHRGQFAERADGGTCESCHNENGFVPAIFTAADHEKTRFALEGAHLAQPCVACHSMTHDENGSFRRFRFHDTRCEMCHEDVHRGQFANSKPPKTCTTCHGVIEWPAIAFDHDRDSSYKLEGEHRRVPCGGCHVPVTENGETFVRYKPINPSCKTCHTREGMTLRS